MGYCFHSGHHALCFVRRCRLGVAVHVRSGRLQNLEFDYNQIQKEIMGYPSEKFAAARRALMLPQPQGDAAAIAVAFQECSLGLPKIDEKSLDESAKSLLSKLKAYMDTADVADPSGKGRYLVKAEGFDDEQKNEISTLIDELTSHLQD